MSVCMYVCTRYMYVCVVSFVLWRGGVGSVRAANVLVSAPEEPYARSLFLRPTPTVIHGSRVGYATFFHHLRLKASCAAAGNN